MQERARREVAAIQRDSVSGATAILERALALLRETAVDYPGELEEIARELCRAQPAMAGLRTAAALVTGGWHGWLARVPGTHASHLGARDPVAELNQFALRVKRAPAAIARHALPLLALRGRTPDGRLRTARERAMPGGASRIESGTPSPPLRIVTCSSSAAVERTIVAAAGQMPVVASCAESRPALEGRALAARLASQRISVILYTDAGISAALANAEALLVGADAVGPDAFVNKVGTGALCALAAAFGVPVYVLAGREKILPAQQFEELELGSGPPADIWPEGPSHLQRANPYFERISLGSVTLVICDAGPIAPAGIQSASLWR